MRRTGVDAGRAHRLRLEAKYDGLEVNEAHRLRQLEDENGPVKKFVANLSLDREMLKAVIAKKCLARRPEDGRGVVAPAIRSQRATGLRAASR
jgi:hypothetical protein